MSPKLLSAVIASARAIKIHNLKLFSDNNFEITPEQYVVLSMLNDEDELNQNQLGERLFKDKSNVNRLLSILEEKGLVEKNPQIENGKKENIITITELGRSLKSKIKPVVIKSRQKYLKSISEDDLYTCIKVLQTIQENLMNKK